MCSGSERAHWLFLLGQSLGSGIQLGFPRLEFYLSGASKRQQMHRGLIVWVKVLLKSWIMETKLKSVCKERRGQVTWEK